MGGFFEKIIFVIFRAKKPIFSDVKLKNLRFLAKLFFGIENFLKKNFFLKSVPLKVRGPTIIDARENSGFSDHQFSGKIQMKF